MNKIDLDNRTAIITGGASGLGFAVARRCLESGARVILWDIQQETLDRAAAELSSFGEVSTHRVDVADYASVDTAARAVGPVDILVNSAGINRPPKRIASYPLKDWNDVIAIDQIGVFHCCL